MNRFSLLIGSALIGLAGVAVSAIADEPSAPAYSRGGAHGHAIRHFERCLSTVGLSSDQQAAIQSIQSESRATLRGDMAALKAAREKSQADLSSGADKTVLGQDLLDQDAAAARLKSDTRSVHDQIVARLNPDQQNALTGCMQQHRGMGDATSEKQP